MFRRPRRSTNGADFLEDRNDPLHNATLTSQTNVYPFTSDNSSSMRQLQRHVRRKKQQRCVSLKFMQLYYWWYDGLGRLVAITTTLVLCYWISQTTLLQMMTSQSSKVVTTKIRVSSNRRILNRLMAIDMSSFSAIPIVYLSKRKVKHRFTKPSKFRSRSERPDFGGIDLRIAEERRLRTQERTIYHDYHADIGYAETLAEQDDDDEGIESYYAFDDDAKRNPYVEYDDPDMHLQKQCRRTNWHRDVPLNCNSLHEYDFPHSIAIARSKFLRCVP